MADVQPPKGTGEPQQEPAWPGWAAATAICLRFYSRLPAPNLGGETDLHALPDFRLIPRALPLAACVIALPPALVLALAGFAGVNPTLTAALAITALIIATGAFHEDGLADTADGLFGGHTAERRLEIMKDSRVGSFGAVALMLSLLLRVSALAAILTAAGPWAAIGTLFTAAAWSRTEALRLLAGMAPARPGGAAAAVGRPQPETVWIARGLAAAIGLVVCLTTPLPVGGLIVGMALASLSTSGLARLARRLIGGQTGDIVGAAQQLGEIAVYVGFAFMLAAIQR